MKMRSISGLGLGLSLVFGCLLLALIAELYYLLWWKKRIITKIDENGTQIPSKSSHFFYIFCCWKNPSSSSSRSTAQQLCSSPTLVHEPQSSSHSNKDLWLKQEMGNFPRFLFTITEETKEDLESEDGVFKNRKQSTSRSNLSDLLQILETPFLTPLASPSYFTPPLTPSFSDYHHHNVSPFFESERDAEFNRLRCSPPPKFKFLRDAEEKLIQRRKIMGNGGGGGDDADKDEENGQFITLNIVTDNQEDEDLENSDDLGKVCFSSSSSQVLHLVSSSSSTYRETLQQQINKPHVNLDVC